MYILQVKEVFEKVTKTVKVKLENILEEVKPWRTLGQQLSAFREEDKNKQSTDFQRGEIICKSIMVHIGYYTFSKLIGCTTPKVNSEVY